MTKLPHLFLLFLRDQQTPGAAREQAEHDAVAALVAIAGATPFCGRAWSDVVAAAAELLRGTDQ